MVNPRAWLAEAIATFGLVFFGPLSVILSAAWYGDGLSTEADEFSKDYKKFKKAGIEIVGISKDDVTSHRKFCDKMNIPYILLADVETEVCKKFGVWGLKKFMGREFMGINRSTFLVNEKGKIFKVFPKVKPKGHAKEVLEAFQK